MKNPLTIRHTTAERLAAELREEISSGRLAPGAPLREEELARTRGVSRHVIRETLRLLASEGLAEYSAFKGARVSFISADDVRDIYGARRLFEVGALRALGGTEFQNLATIHGQYAQAVDQCEWNDAFRLDMEFHGAIVAAANSNRVAAWHKELFQALSLAHLVRPEFRENGLSSSVAQHAEIVVALAANDFERAERALLHHLSHAESLLTERVATPKKRERVARGRKADGDDDGFPVKANDG